MPNCCHDGSRRFLLNHLGVINLTGCIIQNHNQIELSLIDGPFAVDGVTVTPVPILHGQRPILGFRFGRFAYLTDCSAIPDASWPLLDGLDVLVLDALRHRPHPTHFSVQEAVAAIARIQPGRALLTHICHDLPHEETNRALPSGVELAYDGQQLEVTVARG